MQRILSIVCALLCCFFMEGCGQTGADRQLFVKHLDELGFFDYSTDRRTAGKSVLEQGWVGLYDDNVARLLHADAEDLAEGGVGEFVGSLNNVLSVKGKKLPVPVDFYPNDSDGAYYVEVEGKRYVVWDVKDIETEEMWERATYVTHEIVNGLLSKAGLPDRVYAVNGGNDLFFFLLTPEQFNFLVSYKGEKIEPADLPYVPTMTPPLYGASLR